MEKVLVIDDHPLVLRSITSILEKNYEILCSDSFGDECIDMVDRVDHVLLDYNLGTLRATECASGKNLHTVNTLLFSGLSDPDEIATALEGCSSLAFVGKHVEPSCLHDAIQAARHLSEKSTWDMTQKKFIPLTEAFQEHNLLSPKEREVYTLLREGMTDKAIADKLCRSIHTIRVQIRAIKQKKGLGRRS